MNPHYDIDWTETYKAYIESGKTMAAFWRQDLSNHCRGSHYPTYQRFVKRINNQRMRHVHAERVTEALDMPVIETESSVVKVKWQMQPEVLVADGYGAYPGIAA